MDVHSHCSSGGAPAHRQPTPSKTKRMCAWFVHGDRHRGDRYECENGHGWTSMTLQFSHGPKVRMSGLWRAAAYNRTIIPTP